MAHPSPSRRAGAAVLPFAAAVFGVLTQPLRAQTPPGTVLPTETTSLDATPAPGSPAEIRWKLAQQALAGPKPEDAIPHLLAALAFHPDSPPLLLDLVRATAALPDANALWRERFVRTNADAQGRLDLDAAARKVLAPPASIDEPKKLAELRAQAAAELVRAAAKLKPGKGSLGNAQVVALLVDLLQQLGRGAPQLLRMHGQPLGKAAAACTADVATVLDALVRVAKARPTAAAATAAADPLSTDPQGQAARDLQDRAMRAARILAGLQRQAAFKDLQGPPPPDLGAAGAQAGELLHKLEGEALAAARVWTIAELEALSPDERDAFTLGHRDWLHPGVATSPEGRYRIETICGHGTLLGAAKTVELHHARLVDHFGADPFTNRPGTVRIVPESHDLETEGAPFWWAGGFQGGDRTTLRFAWGDIPGLGRGLTHELTHRFDGVVHAFLPSWYGEGHASWTAAHYGKMAETHCTDGWLDIGTCAHTYYKGYGDPQNLEKLLRGTIKDYRDNYFAGYSLCAFLRSWPPPEGAAAGTRLFRGQLDKWQQNGRAGAKDPFAFFVATFCDGKEGRPKDFAGFVALWQPFVRGCYEWLDDRKQGNEWIRRYTGRPDGDAGGLVMDEPTWSWARARAEPWFGQDHALAAALLLAAAGDLPAAGAAAEWSLQVDGWHPATVAVLAKALLAGGHAPAAAAVQALAGERGFPTTGADAAVLSAQLPKVRAYVDALQATATALRGRGGAVAADALLGERDRLGALLLLPPAADGALVVPTQPRLLTGGGLVEDGLTGFEDRRTAELWYATPEGDLHVGRSKPRDGTGIKDRAAHQRDAFVRTVAWQPAGDYVLRGRVHFTTSYVSGAIVFGHQRRDRDLRLHFSAGDFRYAIGKDEKDNRFPDVHLHLEGTSERDGKLPDTNPTWTYALKEQAASFAYELRVHGPAVVLAIEGEPLLRYTTHDSQPIEGHVGFAMGMGAVRVQEATVQRLDAGGGGIGAGPVPGLDVARQPTAPLDELLLQPTRGIPRHDCGTMVLWLPQVPPDQDPAGELDRALPLLAKMLRETHDHPQAWVLAVPAGSKPELVAGVQQKLAEYRPQPLPVVEHRVGAPFPGNDPWLLFVDAEGVLRAAADVGDPKLFSKVQPWARRFRAR